MTAYCHRGARELDPEKRAKRDAEIRRLHGTVPNRVLGNRFGLDESRICQIARGYARHVKRSANCSTEDLTGTTTRACMCCGEAFESEGIHNRMCTGCKSRGYASTRGW